ncbi:MAG: AbrB/MazE/SpoVT family DNA-binding domain-containing protein [Propionibacteriaceae bacterium]|nr:AbrB/MazE/SpoVT family DNA-binding domain-containing protein [Propionibacteriaceae bacterium]
MVTATMTSKGQITIPAQIRARFNLQPGDQLDFWEDETSSLRLTPRTRRIEDFFGIFPYDGPPLAIEDFDSVIADAVVEDWLSQ